ncbi:unnamed protein product [Prunus brigantina]
MQCVSTCEISICINGELIDPFSPSSGIRQGDPLSPYLFVLCIEKLSHIIVDAVKRRLWKPIKTSRNGPNVSHLFFADDLVLFAEATPCQARVMKDCLDLFCSASGQTVNFAKSAIFCSPNTCKMVAKEIGAICGSPITEDLGKYLGLPLLHSRVTKGTYNGLLDKVQNRLAAWKRKCLSLAGRATLIQAVTSSIPVYTMQTVKLPGSICEDLDRINRDFFWSGSGKKQKVHLCQWDLVCRPKCRGGIGLKKTADMNRALLAKIGWRMHTRDQGLWAQIYEKKYLKGCSILDTHGVSKQDCSATWRSVLYGVELLKKGMVWRVGNGEHVKFWKDNWVADLPLLQYAGAQSGIDLDCKVSNFFKEGWWDIAKLRAVLDEVMVQKITCFPVGFGGNSQDAQIWKPTSNGIFTVKSAFQLIHGGSIWSNMCWKGLWSMSIPPKLKVFLWLVFQGKILTNEQRVRRHLAVESSCSVCGWHSETIIHTLRDCGRAKEVWLNVLNPSNVHDFFLSDYPSWLRSNLFSKAKWEGRFHWNIMFVFTCWYVWKWRNKYIFNDAGDLPYDPRMIICAAVLDWVKASSGNCRNVPRTQVMLRWEPPGSGWVKLNVDGTCMTASGKIGAGGVIRDCVGEWCAGFAVNLGKGRILDAEIWGLFFGLRLAVAKGFIKIIIEMDSQIAVNLFQQRDSLCFHPLAALLSNCGQMLRHVESWVIQHIFREKNGLADCLAKWSQNLDLNIQFFTSAPIWASSALADDLLGVATGRLICTE